ncbi:MAG: hypothetical protein OEZ01_08090, partial [Candidatus Heimdallarchaeota archaeon]|nr:hypothetical protein [Candidatus Heimdallarchaeota archaeon]
MVVYIRVYDDFSYEIVQSNKRKLHIYINPGKKGKLSGIARENDIEINTDNLTHILSLETSIKNEEMIKRTLKLAELSNKPIITNQESAGFFRENGLSVKQLRIISHNEEIISGLSIVPVYQNIINETEKELKEKQENKNNILEGVNKTIKYMFTPGKWKTTKFIKKNILPKEPTISIDTSKPLAIVLNFGKGIKLLCPLDERGLEYINDIINETKPWLVIIPNHDVSFTKSIIAKTKLILITNNKSVDDEVLIIPKSYNSTIEHDTLYGGLYQWLEIPN